MEIALPPELEKEIKAVPQYQTLIADSLKEIMKGHRLAQKRHVAYSDEAKTILAESKEDLKKKEEQGYTREEAFEEFFDAHEKIQSYL